MWWIIGIIVVILIIAFLLTIIHCAGKNISDEVQARLDEEQIKAVDEYIRGKNKK